MKNFTPSRLKYFLLIVILIFGFFLSFKEVNALTLIPSEEKKTEQNSQGQAKEETIKQKAAEKPEEQATPTVSSPNLEEKPLFERNAEIIILLVITAILTAIVIGTFIYFFGKRKR